MGRLDGFMIIIQAILISVGNESSVLLQYWVWF